MSKQSETYRLQMLRRLQNRYSQGDPPEVLEAKEVIAKASEQEARDRKAITRLSTPLPEPNLCPQCWFIHGRETPLTHAIHAKPNKFDRLICNLCNYDEERAANSIF